MGPVLGKTHAFMAIGDASAWNRKTISLAFYRIIRLICFRMMDTSNRSLDGGGIEMLENFLVSNKSSKYADSNRIAQY